MKTRRNRVELTALLGLMAALGASPAFAGPMEVTILDHNPLPWGWTGTNTIGLPTDGNFGAAKEDNEVEPDPAKWPLTPGNTERDQKWDLEAFVVKGNSLFLIGGYDFVNGLDGGRPGDLFIKNGGSQPGGIPLTNPPGGEVLNAIYGYSYAIDLSLGGAWAHSGFGTTANVYALSGTSRLTSVANDSFGANPYVYAGGGTAAGTVGLTYTTGLTAAGVDGLTGLALNLQGGNHNVLELNLGSLMGSGTWLSYTMSCGNDSIKGHIPDSGTSALLLGLGLGTLSLLGLRRRQIR